MVDAGGPGTHAVKVCTTAGLSDLGDTEGFGDPGIENKLYAFQLSGGVYKRVEVPVATTQGPLSFGDLSDITVGNVVVNRHYRLHYTENGWKPITDIITAVGGWQIEIKPALPYLHLKKNSTLHKILNKGQLLVSYVPGRKKNVVVAETEEHGYVLGMRGAKNGTLKLVSEFPFRVAPGSTVCIEVILGDHHDDFVTLVPGVKLRWDQRLANKLLNIYIRIPRQQEDPIVLLSIAGVEKQIAVENLSLNTVHLGHFKLRRLYYSIHGLTVDYLNTLAFNPIP